MGINFTLQKYLRVFCLIFLYQLAGVYNVNAKSIDGFKYEETLISFISQSITFGAIPTKVYGDVDFDPLATASSGLTVIYSTSNSNVATIVRGKIHIVGAGICTIYAYQSGDGKYDVAPQASQRLIVNKKTLKVIAGDKTKIYGGANPLLTASYEGFVGSDNVIDIDEEPVLYVSTIRSVGSYPITVSGGNDDNYTFSYVNGSLKVKPATSVNFKAEEKPRIWPNPAKSIVHVLNFPENSVFEIYNVTGAMVKRGIVEAGTIDVENLSNGVYILKINEFKQRIIKQ